jgi:hypothetical protein
MKTDAQRWRLVISDGLNNYKICSFWGWNKDETLFFKLYSDDERLHEVDVDTIEKQNTDGTITVTQKIAFDSVKSTDFEVNKKSFHPSGFTHDNDRSGARFQSGLKTLPFKAIENYLQLMLIFPKCFNKFPQVDTGGLRKNDVVISSSIFQGNPFQIEVFVVRGDKKIFPPPPHECSMIFEIFCGEQEKFLLFVRGSQSPGMVGAPFPPMTFVGTMLNFDPSDSSFPPGK